MDERVARAAQVLPLSTEAGPLFRLEGVAAVLHVPMRGVPYALGAPSALGLIADAALLHRDHNVGVATRLWVEDGRVLWQGHLHPPDIIGADPDRPLTIPFPEYRRGVELAQGMIARQLLVAVPHLVEGSTSLVRGTTFISGWRVAQLKLLSAGAAPWPGLTLALR